MTGTGSAAVGAEKLSAGDERGRGRAALRPRRRAAYDRCGPRGRARTRKPADCWRYAWLNCLDFQNERYARGYLETVLAIAGRDGTSRPKPTSLTTPPPATCTS